MDIEIKNLAKDFSIDDHIIREMSDRESSSKKPVPHFQAKISRNERSQKKHIKCLISYFDGSGKFLGLDEAYGYHESGLTSEIISSITIPSETARMVCEFREEFEERGFYYWAGRAATVMGLLLLVSLLSKSVL
jgi:hypothetical protein